MNKMKMIWLGLAVVLFAGAASAGSYLTLGTQDGLAEKCQVRDYDANKGVVRIMTGGAIVFRPVSSFAPKAPKKIEKWASDKAFLSSSDLKIRVEKQEEKTEWEVAHF